MFMYYNIIWIICMILFLTMVFMYFRRKKVRSNLANGNYATATTTADPNFVIIDMNGRQSYRPTRPATYDPPPPTQTPSTFTTYRPSTSDVEPPPPSYQDYSKDHRVPNV